MAIIVVGGSTKGVGKTTLVCGLIAALPEFRWTAIKITTHDHGVDAPAFPQLSEKGVEQHEPQPAYGSANMIWEETSAGQGTDTARYLAAGAHRAFLCTPLLRGDPQRQDFRYLLDELWPHFGPGTNVIFESNSILQHLRPDLCLMVVVDIRIHTDGESLIRSFKHSYLQAQPYVDATVVIADTDWVKPEGAQHSNRPPTPIFYLAALEKISPEMLAWIKERLPAPPQPDA